MPDDQATATETKLDSSGIARTPTGEIAEPTRRTAESSTSTQGQTETKTEAKTEDGKSLLNQDRTKDKEGAEKPPEQKAPETYTEFKVPEGFTLDAEVAKEAGVLFKGMNLTQDQAQSLVDFYAAKTKEAFEQPFKAYQDMRKEQVDAINSDPRLGHRLPEIKTNFTKMLDQHVRPISPKAVDDFKQAMDVTGAGDWHAFVTVMDIISQLLIEPAKHVSGARPSPFGQNTRQQPISAAQAMYPNLPSRDAV